MQVALSLSQHNVLDVERYTKYIPFGQGVHFLEYIVILVEKLYHIVEETYMVVPPLHEYQKKALQFSLERPDSYLGLDMGLGKTRITLEWCKDKTAKGILVIAPLKSIYTTWPDEIEKWKFDYSYTILHGKDKLDNLGLKRNLYLTNFESIQWLFESLKLMFKLTKNVPFRTVVIDEGSMIKSPSTKRFKTLRKLRDIFYYRIMLSGTPAPNTLLDLWSQYFFLDGGARLFKAYSKFRFEHFMPLDYKQFTWAIKSKEDKLKIYNKIKDITFRLDAKDYIKLPKRIDNIIKLKLPEKLQQQYKHLEKKFFLELDKEKVEVLNAAALSMKLRQFIQGGVYIDGKGAWEQLHKEKLDKLKEMVEVADGQGILCPIQFKFELEMIRSIWPKVPAIVGGVDMKVSAQYIKDWNLGKIPLLICHPRSLSHAVNMQAGSHIVLWYSLTWSSEQYQQLNARVLRQGQKNNVIIHHLVMDETIDNAVMSALKAKIKGQNQLLDFIKNYHQED